MNSAFYDLYLTLNTMVFIVVLVVLLARGKETAFSPIMIYCAFHFMVFVFRPWVEWHADLDSMWRYMRFQPRIEDRVTALGVASLGLVSLAAGHIFATRNARPFAGPLRDLRPSSADIRALYMVLFALTPLIMYSMWVTRYGVGLSERSSVMMDIVDGSIVMTNSTGYITDAQDMILGLAALSFIFKRLRWLAFTLISIYMARKMLTGGGRWGIVLPMAAYGLVYMYFRYMKWPPVKYIFLMIPLALIFYVLGEDRYFLTKYLEGNTSEIAVEVESNWVDNFDGPDFANFEYLTFIVATVPEKTDTYTYGTQYLQIFTEPIPRILWSGKPAGAPIKMFDLNDHGNFFGLTPSLHGDYWMSFGWIGVALGGLLVGFVSGRVYRAFLSGSFGVYGVCAYLMFAPLLIQLFRDGGIVPFTKFMTFVVGPIFIVKAVSKVRLGRTYVQKNPVL